jgi:hypothetical protein
VRNRPEREQGRLTNTPGTIAMARGTRTRRRRSSSSTSTTTKLNFREPTTAGCGHTITGKVIEGMDVEQDRQDDRRGGCSQPTPQSASSSRVRR